jgi:hypothetical protein
MEVLLQTIDQAMLGIEARDHGGLRLHLAAAKGVDLLFPAHHHRPIVGQRPSRCPQVGEARFRSDQPFDPTVVLLEDVVQVLALL